jgi:hypothetical protein
MSSAITACNRCRGIATQPRWQCSAIYLRTTTGVRELSTACPVGRGVELEPDAFVRLEVAFMLARGCTGPSLHTTIP